MEILYMSSLNDIIWCLVDSIQLYYRIYRLWSSSMRGIVQQPSAVFDGMGWRVLRFWTLKWIEHGIWCTVFVYVHIYIYVYTIIYHPSGKQKTHKDLFRRQWKLALSCATGLLVNILIWLEASENREMIQFFELMTGYSAAMWASKNHPWPLTVVFFGQQERIPSGKLT